MNFGHKILITIILFVSFIIGLVVFAVSLDDIQLVSENYYEKEILYQDEINKMQNVQTHYGKVIWFNDAEQNLTLSFQSNTLEGVPEGQIQLFRPSDSRKDLQMAIQTNAEFHQNINTAHLDKGLWKVKIDWSHSGKDFFEEQSIIIQ